MVHKINFSISENERHDAGNLIRILQKKNSESDSSVTGFNVGANSGESAGQTIFHAHIHLIPRRDGDTPKPRGGVTISFFRFYEYGNC